MATATALQPCPLLINNEWVTSQSPGNEVTNSSTGEVISHAPHCTRREIDQAVQAAARAFPAWADTPVVDRTALMFRYRELTLRHVDRIARMVSMEHGKTRPEAVASVRRGIEFIEYACSAPTLLMGKILPNMVSNIDGDSVRCALGVVAGITPFNFPAMVPMWMFPLAIVCGNTFVLKPSERTPLTANILGELFIEAGGPPGVLNVVHGAREAVEAIIEHPLIKAISFVGSTPVAKLIYEKGTAAGKRVQANGGAKNRMVIMPDADPTFATAAVQAASFGCAGERCMAGSVAVAVGGAGDSFVQSLQVSADRMKVGRTDLDDVKVDMGPVVTREHMQRVLDRISAGEQEGARLVRDGRSIRVADAPKGYFIGPTLFDDVRPDMGLCQEEIFGPVLSIVRVNSLEEAIENVNSSPFGNGAVIFTRDGRAAREFKQRVNAGMVGINVGVPAAMAFFPFAGWNDSFFGDLHIQGHEGVLFYTRERVTMTRWPDVGSTHRDTFTLPTKKP
jgi:malonate-semialdehyde dehydrogenase (acetylating)/methylmalonate-semialdehyde dehydrogenase